MKSSLLAILLLCFLAPTLAQSEKVVTAQEKRKFRALIRTLKTKGEYFTEASIQKVVPYQRVLFAFTEKDINAYWIFPLVMISNGLMEHTECREYAVKNFATIQHPVLKIAWGAMLLDTDMASPEIIRFLYQVLEDPKQKKLLQGLRGAFFEKTEIKIIVEYSEIK